MAKQNKNKSNSSASKKKIFKLYKDNRSLINGIGIAALAGVAVYSLVKFVPFKQIICDLEEKFEDKFADRETEVRVGEEI